MILYIIQTNFSKNKLVCEKSGIFSFNSTIEGTPNAFQFQ